ncbi:hypothetical protein [Blastococcus brunescens]|uniref:Uncharacterized protein n=1 Tax=Blastococcus brunescens TaxID=1564165 RepID=A0ABZ1B913_9ACTN|nr:hypothetical protein [Blastococcus sp. BMG 8361]WRL67302.1 hypothetical protein U6N30_23215 [Blastococcus sp. BMG 8361]
MISMTPTFAPADLLGQGGLDARPVYAPGLCAGLAERAVAPTAASQGTGLPAGGTAVRLRPVSRQAIGHDVVTKHVFDNNGTTLGSHSSRRPQS